jgi:hypothetical protein
MNNPFARRAPQLDPVNMEELESNIRQLSHRQEGRAQVRVREFTPTQIIGHAISRLTYAEAVAMGRKIEAIQNGEKDLTAAIQEWASGWEDFAGDTPEPRVGYNNGATIDETAAAD